MDGLMIYVVDDDPDVREAASLLLRSYGYQTRLFGDAPSCMEAVLVCLPDCILSDLHMPIMDGNGLMEALLTAGLHLPVVVMTASPRNSSATTRAATMAAAVIGKPFEPDDLVITVSRALSRN